jgi:pimeloyl-ACP methyl ester carboxylesterase
MAATTTSYELPDGRVLDLLLGGMPQGIPLLAHHGSPSDATAWSDWDDAARNHGFRLIAMSRPGYASSTRQPGRVVADAASDAEAVLDMLGHETFATMGASGGGPHALACAALMPKRCRGAATLAGVGPYGAPDLDFVAGMGPENVAEFGAALAGEDAIRAWLTEHAEPFRHVRGFELATAFGGLLPPVDAQILSGGYAEHMAAEMRRALAAGFDGLVDDDLAFTTPWGFDLEQIRVPVTVWQGDLDLMVPFAHGGWLVEHLPNAQAAMVPGHGHISLGVTHRDAILANLLR